MNFSNNPIHQVQLQKSLGLSLDTKLSFYEQIKCILSKTGKLIGLTRKLQPIIPIIYTSFLTPLFDYGNVMYDHAFNEFF